MQLNLQMIIIANDSYTLNFCKIKLLGYSKNITYQLYFGDVRNSFFEKSILFLR